MGRRAPRIPWMSVCMQVPPYAFHTRTPMHTYRVMCQPFTYKCAVDLDHQAEPPNCLHPTNLETSCQRLISRSNTKKGLNFILTLICLVSHPPLSSKASLGIAICLEQWSLAETNTEILQQLYLTRVNSCFTRNVKRKEFKTKEFCNKLLTRVPGS